MIEQSENIDAFTVALVKVQQEVETVRKDAKNAAFKQNGKESTYASLKSTWEACRAELTANGFAVTQWPGAYCRDTNQMKMTTCLLHISGQWQRATAEIPMGKADAQGYGSAVTYARRYALQAAVGLSPDDDDGNAAARPVERIEAEAKRISPADFQELQTLMDRSGTTAEKICEGYKIEAVAMLPAKSYPALKARLSKIADELSKVAA